MTPHVTKNDKGRRRDLDRRTTRQPGYAVSLIRRWLVEKGFEWLKQTGPLGREGMRGLETVDWQFAFNCAAHKAPKTALIEDPDHSLNSKARGKATIS